MNVDALAVRRAMGRLDWRAPEPFPSAVEHHGWVLRHARENAHIIISEAPFPDENGGPDVEWIHASMTRPTLPPSYDDLVMLHRAVFGDRFAYQVFAPPAEHVNIHERALHLWGRADGQPVTPRAMTAPNGRLSV